MKNEQLEDLFKKFGDIYNPSNQQSALQELDKAEEELKNNEFYKNLVNEDRYLALIYKYSFVTKRLQLIINTFNKAKETELNLIKQSI